MNTNRQPPPGAVFGAILVAIGLAVLATRYVPAFEDAAFWPFFIIGPGIVLFILGLILPNTGMIIGGTVVTSVGLILAWQNATGLWATWAYVWALVGPGASGLGTFIGGLRVGNGRDGARRASGRWSSASPCSLASTCSSRRSSG